MKKALSIVISAILVLTAFVVPSFATGTTTFTDGQVIYAENFDNLKETDTEEKILSDLGWEIKTGEADSPATVYSAIGGKLRIDSQATDCGYSTVMVYNGTEMPDLVKTVYTVRMEITSVGEVGTNYSGIVLNYDGATTYQVPMVRGNGTYRNQVRTTDWYDYDGLSGTWMDFGAELVDGKLNKAVIRIVSYPDKGISIYVNDIEVSVPSDVLGSAPAAVFPGALASYGVGIRSQKGGCYDIDNFAIYAGNGSKITPDLSAYGFTELAPYVAPVTTAEVTTEAPVTTAPEATTAAPATTTAAPATTTAAPATTTAAPAITTAPASSEGGCGSLVALSVLAAFIPAACIFVKKKH